MNLGLVGRKIGMTRVFTDDGDTVPVTVVDVSNNRVTQLKTPESDGYAGVQVTFGKRRANRVIKPAVGHFKNAGVEAGHTLREFRVAPEKLADLKVGGVIAANLFEVGQMVDVTGVSQGKGFQGAIKRHNFSSNRASHGNSRSHNTVGSISMAQDPGRVFPGKKMPGHMGAVKRTAQSLQIMRIDEARQLLMIRGAVPGSRGGDVIVVPAKRAKKASAAKPAAKAADDKKK